MEPVKRFIAGAVCPRCGKMDSVRMHRDEEREHRECIECGFSDSLRLDGRPEPKEIDTRVHKEKHEDRLSAQATKPKEIKAEPIRLMEPGKP
ncbi:MAG: YheV family putative metal-binding protein [Oceanospirillales bacterium]|nr:MAG: YheV family putative metal-binding protein [Oceanospirillales bacterium]